MKIFQISQSSLQHRGATIGDILAYLALTSIFLAIFIPAFGTMFSDAEKAKLESDVHTLNQAVSTFLASGGDLSGDLSVAEVITRLREAPPASSVWLIGAKETLAVNLEPVMQSPAEANSDQARVVWSPAKRHFRVAESGAPGAKSFTAIRIFNPDEFSISVTSQPEPEKKSGAAQMSREQDELYAPYRR